MPLGFLGAYLLGEGVKAGTGFLSSLWQNLANRRAANRQYAKDVEMMHYQEQFNSPEKQKARLIRAGINPATAYGNTGISGNLTGEAPRYREPEKKMDFTVGSGDSAMRALMNYQDLSLKQASEDKYKADIEATQAKTGLTQILKNIYGVDYKNKVFTANELEVLAPYVLEIKKQEAKLKALEVQRTEASIPYIEEQIKASKAERNLKYIQARIQEYSADLADAGIDPNSPALLRFAVANMDRLIDIFRGRSSKPGSANNRILRGLLELLTKNGF